MPSAQGGIWHTRGALSQAPVALLIIIMNEEPLGFPRAGFWGLPSGPPPPLPQAFLLPHGCVSEAVGGLGLFPCRLSHTSPFMGPRSRSSRLGFGVAMSVSGQGSHLSWHPAAITCRDPHCVVPAAARQGCKSRR